jgi:hypothetical protein
VWSFVKPFNFPVDYIVFAALIGLLIAASVLARRGILIVLFVVLLLLALQDQSRWQPWFYQYVLMLLAIALAGPDRPEAAFNTCCLIVAATYVWSGLAKLNPHFMGETFPFLVEPIIGRWPERAQWVVRHAAFVAPFIESGIGVGLLTRRFRRVAVFCGIGMHVFILIVIGPLGRGFNAVVWPWNLAMIAFLLILFLRRPGFGRTGEPEAWDIMWGRAFAFHKVIVVLLGIMPVLSFFNLWDHYLSSALYSGNRNDGTVYVSDNVFARLPHAIENYVYEDGPNRNSLSLYEWSLGEMNVPSYPEIRIYKNVARRICGYALTGSGDASGVELVVDWKFALVNSNRQSVYDCSGVQGR